MRRLVGVILGILFLFNVYDDARAAPQNADLLSTRLVINLPSRTIELYSGDKRIKRYPVAIGKPSTPTPLGDYHIINKDINPAWYPPDRPGVVIPSGPYNPLGYRWMGFLPTFGVHGTNVPDSIGLAVSNGCVRMYEEDVEELFEIVKIGVPLKITYERVQLGLDDNNQAFAAVYPDIYGYQAVTFSGIRERLEAHALNDWIPDATIHKLIEAESGKPVILAAYRDLIVNGKLLPEKVIITQEGTFIPLQAVANVVKQNIVWNEAGQTVKVGSHVGPAVKKGNALFTLPESLSALFGGKQTLSQSALEVEILTLRLNGAPVPGEFPRMATLPIVPADALAAALGQTAHWDETQKLLTVHSRIVPVEIVDSRPYIAINRIYEYFGAYVYWDEAARSIELTYPFQLPGGE